MSMKDSQEHLVRLQLSGNRIIECRISIASTIVIGPGPRPRKGASVVAQWVDEEIVLMIETAVLPAETASISVGPGKPPD